MNRRYGAYHCFTVSRRFFVRDGRNPKWRQEKPEIIRFIPEYDQAELDNTLCALAC
jgi:hypothetical protein